MREIKFMAWDKDNKIMLKGVNVKDGFREIGEGEIAISQIFDEREDNPYIPMQYTGLKDKNGREIYEGDIIKDTYGQVLVVSWSDTRCGWVAIGDIGEKALTYYQTSEVVGNIYQNPELIK